MGQKCPNHPLECISKFSSESRYSFTLSLVLILNSGKKQPSSSQTVAQGLHSISPQVVFNGGCFWLLEVQFSLLLFCNYLSHELLQITLFYHVFSLLRLPFDCFLKLAGAGNEANENSLWTERKRIEKGDTKENSCIRFLKQVRSRSFKNIKYFLVI